MKVVYLDKTKVDKFYQRSDFAEGPLLNVDGCIIKVSSLDTLVPFWLKSLVFQYIDSVLHPFDDCTAIVKRTPRIVFKWRKK